MPRLSVLSVYDDFVAFPRSGDTCMIDGQPDKLHVCWWSGEENFDGWGNRISGLAVDTAGMVSSWWTTVAPQPGYEGQLLLDWDKMHAHDLRSYHFQPFAAIELEAGPCIGDSGGPVLVRVDGEGDAPPSWRIVGVIALIDDTDGDRVVGEYGEEFGMTAVRAYADWIRATIAE